MANFKYEIDHQKLPCACPPDDEYLPSEMTAFRFVHEDLSHSNNFKPVWKIDPNRFTEETCCEQKCKALGLSLFSTLTKAEKKLKKLVERKPELKEVFGNSIAEVQLDINDGIKNKPSGDGHFTFHEYDGSNIRSKSKLVKTVEFEN